METATSIGIVTAAAAASFAVALLLHWATLSALFHLLPRPRKVLVLPTPPGEAHPEPGGMVPVRAWPSRPSRAGAFAAHEF